MLSLLGHTLSPLHCGVGQMRFNEYPPYAEADSSLNSPQRFAALPCRGARLRPSRILGTPTFAALAAAEGAVTRLEPGALEMPLELGVAAAADPRTPAGGYCVEEEAPPGCEAVAGPGGGGPPGGGAGPPLTAWETPLSPICGAPAGGAPSDAH